jgi:hypothetical protein
LAADEAGKKSSVDWRVIAIRQTKQSLVKVFGLGSGVMKPLQLVACQQIPGLI